ncbi:MAG: 5'-methylthioadenosine/adenosylhomocysteine nucleosidase [Wenyingzhuangia sp.]|uniref:5'-methylthioadenosine/adenosylhomocysteine nucleosidase n=1 Tax=Wenyingzhuangia sp. TaxID=1964193 RepID=UPI00321AD4C6
MIGIISAMHDELSELLCLLKHKKTTVLGNREYYSGSIGCQQVVIVFSKWGKVAAAITTTTLINNFQPQEIIFSGVAGAINPSLNIGDIVYGTSLVQHDMDASPLFDKFEIPLIGKSAIFSTENQNFYKCIKQFHRNYFKFISKEEAAIYNIQKPKIIKGMIASGDEFISDTNKIEELQKELPSLECVEMEGAAVAQVCHEYQIDFSIIRIISDKADSNAYIDFPTFTKQIASRYAKGIIENYCNLV